jgi:hyperosmotically inducible protein
MTTKKLAALAAVLIVAALAIGCDNTTTNANTANSNMATSNTATTYNSNANTANANANTNANTKKTPTKEDVEKNKESYEKEAKGAGRKVGSGVNDMWLWVKARFDLAAADDLRDSTINVDVDNAVVTLTGTVANAAQKTKAETIAKSVEGVKSVKNELKVSAGGGNANANANTNTNKNANTKK